MMVKPEDISDFQIVPNHVAVIMDGNRRWARAHGLTALSGHRQVAVKVLEPLVEHAVKRGISYLTFWAFSTENWQRDAGEVMGLMTLFSEMIGRFGQKMHRKGIRIMTIGDLGKLSVQLQDRIAHMVRLTENNTRITVVFAVNYGGRDEIVRAMGKMSADNIRLGKKGQISEAGFSRYLDTAGIPDPDVIVRPGGEKRLSGFLLWQSQYAELIFTDWYMPEFTPAKFDEVLNEYAGRRRRFGR